MTKLVSLVLVAQLAYFFCILVPPTIAEGNECDPRIPFDPSMDIRWKLFCYGDPTTPLYEDESTEEYLRLCGEPGTETCASPKCFQKCTPTRLLALERGKSKVIAIRRQVGNLARSGVLWCLWFCIAFLGLCIFLVGQFRLINLPYFGDPFIDDPTGGIKFVHFMWMRWTIVGNKNVHWLTYVKPDAFLYRWVTLANQPWDRPVTPPDLKKLEPRDHEHPPWEIDDILLDRKECDNPEPTWNVLEEYWVRIYTWAWARYRYRKAPHIFHRDA